MTTATRVGNAVTRLSFGAMTSMGLLALPIVASHPGEPAAVLGGLRHESLDPAAQRVGRGLIARRRVVGHEL